jgi:hypothetical protein
MLSIILDFHFYNALFSCEISQYSHSCRSCEFDSLVTVKYVGPISYNQQPFDAYIKSSPHRQYYKQNNQCFVLFLPDGRHTIKEGLVQLILIEREISAR